jgi:hypothetical protein
MPGLRDISLYTELRMGASENPFSPLLAGIAAVALLGFLLAPDKIEKD